MITKLRIRNFKALRDVEIALTPIHVLIGPNDSGKTSILDALAALCRSVDHEVTDAFLGSWKNNELVWSGHGDLSVTINAVLAHDPTVDYAIESAFADGARRATLEKEIVRRGDDERLFEYNPLDPFRSGKTTRVAWELHGAQDLDGLRPIGELLKGVHYYRWNPQFLALPVAPDVKRRFRMELNGFGLALCLDEILSYDRDRFVQLESRFREVFDQIKSIKLQQEAAYRAPVDDPSLVTMLERADGKGLYFELANSGQLIPASQASDGTLLVLAYLAILYLPEPPRVLLVEEPENGIHPKRLRDILTILRELIQEQSHTQVVLTTHSPYVVDLFEPEEVTLCTKRPNGEVKTTRLSESPTVRKQIDVFTLGEIWTAEDDETIANATEHVEESHE